MFVEDYTGGAELTTEALIQSSPFNVHKIHSKDINEKTLISGIDKFWIFGNFTMMNHNLIPSIVANLKYAIVEYDYKYCKFRSPEKHQYQTSQLCDCSEQMPGKIISAFYHGAMGLWWMSEAQKEHYLDKFPFLLKNDNMVLSSVFDLETLGTLKYLRENQKNEKKGWIVLGSESWVKGAGNAENWCKQNNKEYEVVWNIPYKELLAKLSCAEGFVYLPAGMDTCPRMVCEAKLLNCKLELNSNVQHKDEVWFDTDDLEKIHEYLLASPGIFWNATKKMMDYKPSISGYTTTFNCISQQYPYKQCLESMLQFCDEVCVVDGGSEDGTWNELQNLALKEPRLSLKQIKRDWNHPRSAVFDGMQKAAARELCTKEFCWQMDSDEIVHEDDAIKILDIARSMPKNADLLALPVIEYWGGSDKVRIDVTPWKWRLSRNKSHITHGIPAHLRDYDGDGNLCAKQGTDGCDMIDRNTGTPIEFITFYNHDADKARLAANFGNSHALQQYETWFNTVTSNLPCVFHYSWYDIERKIKLYRNFWTRHWEVLYGKDYTDTPESNMMFDKPWSEVTDDDIKTLAIRLKNETGGWIWHKKWNGNKLPWMTCQRSEPKTMLDIKS